MNYQIGPPPMNPLARLLAAVVGAAVLVGAFFFGFIILAFAVVAGLVLWLVVWIRIWWLRRKLADGASDPFQAYRAPRESPDSEGAIEGDFEVISREEEKD